MLTTQIHPSIQTLLQQVNYVYQHPLHYTYILHKTDGLLHLYDQATMDVCGKTRVVVLDQMKLFAFTNDYNVFYGLRESRFLLFEQTSTPWLAHMPIEAGQEPKPYLESYYLSYNSRKQILICVTAKNFYMVSPGMASIYKTVPPLKHQDTIIYPQKVAEISGLLWIIGYRDTIYFLKFAQTFDSYQILAHLVTGPLTRLSIQHHPKRQFVYVVNQTNEVLLIKVSQTEKKLQVCYKFYEENYLPHYLTLLRLGINTSTTDKFKNRMYICVYCEQKQKESQQESQMVDQIIQNQKEQHTQFSMFIIPTDTQQPTETLIQSQLSENLFQQQQFSLIPYPQTFYISNMPPLRTSPWINVFTQNCLLFLTTKNEVCSINFCSIPEMKLKADQWICMGYKFQMLEKNQVYEERQDQFEDFSEKEEKPLTKEFLDDWSQSILPKYIVLNKAYNRIRSIDL